MSNGSHYEKSTAYQICLRGILDPKWSDWFDGLTITSQGDETLLTGTVCDQAALHGILAKINNLGLTLISVSQLPDGEQSVVEKKKASCDDPDQR